MAIKGNIPDIGKAYILKVGKDLEAETKNREAADEAIGKRVEDEAKNRKAADDALDKKLDKEIADRKKGDDTLSEKIDQEAEARREADDALQKAIDAEQKAREKADNELKSDLGDLSDRVDNVEGSITNIDNNVNGGSNVTVDPTLTESGQAADAKVTGDRLKSAQDAADAASAAANQADQKAESADEKAASAASAASSAQQTAEEAQSTANSALQSAEQTAEATGAMDERLQGLNATKSIFVSHNIYGMNSSTRSITLYGTCGYGSNQTYLFSICYGSNRWIDNRATYHFYTNENVEDGQTVEGTLATTVSHAPISVEHGTVTARFTPLFVGGRREGLMAVTIEWPSGESYDYLAFDAVSGAFRLCGRSDLKASEVVLVGKGITNSAGTAVSVVVSPHTGLFTMHGGIQRMKSMVVRFQCSLTGSDQLPSGKYIARYDVARPYTVDDTAFDLSLGNVKSIYADGYSYLGHDGDTLVVLCSAEPEVNPTFKVEYTI